MEIEQMMERLVVAIAKMEANLQVVEAYVTYYEISCRILNEFCASVDLFMAGRSSEYTALNCTTPK
jgi:hypothetical protein